MANIDYGTILRQIYEAFDNKDVERAVQNVLPDCKVTNVPFGTTMSFRDYFQNWATAFPDGKVEVVAIVSQGDKVIAEFIGRGTFKGVLKGPGGEITPTNKRLEMRFVETYECRNGKIASGRIYFDSATMMKQLGLAMPMETGKAAPRPEAPRH